MHFDLRQSGQSRYSADSDRSCSRNAPAFYSIRSGKFRSGFVETNRSGFYFGGGGCFAARRFDGRVRAGQSFFRADYRAASIYADLGVYSALIWYFGIYESQKIAFLFLGVFVYLLPVVVFAIRAVPEELVQTALTLGASKFQVIRSVLLPAALPDIFDSFRVMNAIL